MGGGGGGGVEHSNVTGGSQGGVAGKQGRCTKQAWRRRLPCSIQQNSHHLFDGGSVRTMPIPLYFFLRLSHYSFLLFSNIIVWRYKCGWQS